MFWSTKVFSAEDTRIIAERSLLRLTEQLKENVYLTDTSLVSESQIRRELEEVVRESTRTLDAQTLAVQLGVPRTGVDAVLADVVRNTDSFFDGIHILPPHRITAIRSAVAMEVTSLQKVCELEKITVKAAEFVFKNDPQVSLVDGYVVPESLLNTHLNSFKARLDAATEPVAFAKLESDRVVLPILKKRLGILVHEQVYTPQVYVETQVARAEEIFKAQGYVHVDNAGGNTKRLLSGDRKLLGPYVVSSGLLKEQQTEIDNHLAQFNWFDTHDLLLAPYLANYFLDFDKYKKLRSNRKPSILVKPALERAALQKVVSEFEPKVKDELQNLSLSVDGSSSLSEFVDKVTLPAVADVAAIVNEMAPKELKLADSVAHQARRQLFEVAQLGLKPRFEAALGRLEGKVFAYLNGVASIEEPAVSKLVFDEFQQYLSDKQFSVPESVEEARQQFAGGAKYVEESVIELRSNAEARLRKLKTKDAAGVLHLAVTLYHSQHFCPHGFLKIRGKLVPKVLKLYEFPTSFNELRSTISKPNAELVEKVKGEVNL